MDSSPSHLGGHLQQPDRELGVRLGGDVEAEVGVACLMYPADEVLYTLHELEAEVAVLDGGACGRSVE